MDLHESYPAYPNPPKIIDGLKQIDADLTLKGDKRHIVVTFYYDNDADQNYETSPVYAMKIRITSESGSSPIVFYLHRTPGMLMRAK